MNRLILITMTMIGLLFSGCASKMKQTAELGSYAYDVELFCKCNIEAIDLFSSDGCSRILIVPSLQGRVMTSTAEGPTGKSYGWINHTYIEKGRVAKHMHAVGGEDRFWIGPEGGPYSLYFEPGKEQIFDHWQVPPFIDTDRYDIVHRSDSHVSFEKQAQLTNAAGSTLSMKVNRTISLLDKRAIEISLEIELPESVKYVGYESSNTIVNTGKERWTKEKGLPSIWALSMLNSSPQTTIVVPYRTDAPVGSTIYNGNYFGEIPDDRISVKDGVIYFKADAKHRAKMGLPFNRAKPMFGSYDAEQGQLTVLYFNLPSEEKEYVNAVWGNTDPYSGDVINTYNDGPVADGTQFGQFYELESSSPAAELAPDESMTHVVRLVHFVGPESDLDAISRKCFGVHLSTIKTTP